jgi:hypothetical protein
MTDTSKIRFPDASAIAEGVRDNIDTDNAVALIDRLNDAEQIWRYFCRRDEMNAEIHLDGDGSPNVRYSPITIAAERVVGWLSGLYYGEQVNYRTAIRN